MKEAVDRILKAEEDARRKIEQARQESQEIIHKARQDAAELIESAVSGARSVALARKEEADHEFARDKEKELKSLLGEVSAKRIEKEKDIPSLSEKIFLRLIQINA